jgi:Co/Zn/Cd efflux system component
VERLRLGATPALSGLGRRAFARPVRAEHAAVTGIGIAVNLLSMRLLAGGKDANLNMKGANLEAWSDMLGSLGVILGALVTKFTGWLWVDSAVAV